MIGIGWREGSYEGRGENGNAARGGKEEEVRNGRETV
jgi:hypothetical protein